MRGGGIKIVFETTGEFNVAGTNHSARITSMCKWQRIRKDLRRATIEALKFRSKNRRRARSISLFRVKRGDRLYIVQHCISQFQRFKKPQSMKLSCSSAVHWFRNRCAIRLNTSRAAGAQ